MAEYAVVFQHCQCYFVHMQFAHPTGINVQKYPATHPDYRQSYEICVFVLLPTEPDLGKFDIVIDCINSSHCVGPCTWPCRAAS